MIRVEQDDEITVPDTTIGRAEVRPEDHDPGHAFLYLPDLSSQTRWSAHAVPMREPQRERKQMGFRGWQSPWTNGRSR